MLLQILSAFRRKLYLISIVTHRWFARANRQPSIQFANIGEGTFREGVKSYIPDATTTARYLLYKTGSDADHCAVCGAGDDPLGPSDDQATADGVPIGINVLGAVTGTIRVVTDGSVVNGNYVKCAANGQVTQAASGNLSFGRAVIGSEWTSGAGEVIAIIPMTPAKYAF